MDTPVLCQVGGLLLFSNLTYLILEVVATTASVLLALVVVISWPKSRNALIFSLICLSKACYLLTRMSLKADDTWRLELGLFALPVQIFMVLGAGLWMLFCYSLFQDQRRIHKGLLVLVGLQVLLGFVRLLVLPATTDGVLENQVGSFVTGFMTTASFALQGLNGLLALLLTIKGWSADLVESRRFLRWVCAVYLSISIFGVTMAELGAQYADGSLRIMLNNGITLWAALTASAMLVLATRADLGKLDSVIARVTRADIPSALNTGVQTSEADFLKFQAVFENQQAYLQHGLTIGTLARLMAIPQYRLRQLIHARLGYRNFNALLHAYRIREACTQLADPDKQNLPVLTIALSLGYQSIAPFNQAFRDLIGQTPTSYRKAHLS